MAVAMVATVSGRLGELCNLAGLRTWRRFVTLPRAILVPVSMIV
jgi:hypothetical protein